MLCVVKKIVPRQKKYHLIFYDFESTTHTELVKCKEVGSDDDEIREEIMYNDYWGRKPTIKMHLVNCVSAMLFCNECAKNVSIDNVTAEQKTTGCQHCRISSDGEQRMHTWINNVHHCEDALRWFIQWIFNGIPGGVNRKETSIVIAHFSGR